ncbi:alkylation response protein AidB-like acyl-CoA dehydrogenase [Streptomyces calvus]|uniref:acyl-CoA dehydrogenase family protein n=1 Tax=Streptomyces calvus TaxID=67282 RepID=UPI003511E02C
MSVNDELTSLLKAVRDVVPTLHKNGVEAEDRRWIPEENIALLEKAGVFRMAVPRRFGGLDLGVAEQSRGIAEIARGAFELFLDRLPGRGITYTNWTEQSQHPLTQVQVATAANKTAAAEALSTRWLDVLQRRADAGEQPTAEEKAAVRGQTAFAVELCRQAVEVLFRASGGSVIQRSVDLQRFHRDMEGFSLHALVQLNANPEVQGRVLGLDPETDFL